VLASWLLLACGSTPGGSDAGVDAPSAEASADDVKPDLGIDVDVDTGPACVPACEDRECGPDGCGGSCGACASGRICSADAVCVPDPEDCSQTCASLGMVCGEHCGEDCGACAAGEVCVDGACECAPSCPVSACGAEDGCGGTCPACPQDESCEGCPLMLSVVEREEVDGQLVAVTLALDFLPEEEDAPLPGMADLRLRVDGVARLAGVALGEALLQADKQLFVDAVSGKPYRRLADGALQLLALSTTSRTRINAGRWLFLRFVLPPAEGGASAPFSVSLIKREQLLAPPEADQLLWGAALDGAVVIWPEVTP
jgi:hypothetical protein